MAKVLGAEDLARRIGRTMPLDDRSEQQPVHRANDGRVEDFAGETKTHETHVEHERVSHYPGRKGRSAMVLLMLLGCLVQAPETLDVTTVGKDPRWQVAGRTTAVVDTNGKAALRMIEVAPVMGLIWLIVG